MINLTRSDNSYENKKHENDNQLGPALFWTTDVHSVDENS